MLKCAYVTKQKKISKNNFEKWNLKYEQMKQQNTLKTAKLYKILNFYTN